VWQWFNFYSASAPPGKEILRVNVDETSVCLFQGGHRGNIFVSKRDEPTERAALNQRRSYITHVAFVSDRADVQPLLPQFVIGNEHVLPARQLAALQAACPAVRLIRQKSSWCNSELFAAMVRALGRALAALSSNFQIVLIFDAAKIHLTRSVFVACRAAGAWPLVVPGRTTWLLQPLDTHIFRGFKSSLRRACMRRRALTADGALVIEGLLLGLCEAIEEVLRGGDWSAAFDHDGFGASQQRVSDRVKKHLCIDNAPTVSSSRPTSEELRCCFPARFRIPYAALWSSFDNPPVRGGPLAARPTRAASATTAAAPSLSRPVTRAFAKRQAAIAGGSGAASSSSAAGPPVAMPMDAPGRPITRAFAKMLAAATSGAASSSSSAVALAPVGG
jgi:hypothetical protein